MDTLVLHLATGSNTIYENCDCMVSSLSLSIGLGLIEVITRLIDLFDLMMMRKIGLPSYRINFVSRWHSLSVCFLSFGLSYACISSS